MRSLAVGHVILAYAQWGRVQMADAEAETAPRPEMQRLVAALRARLSQLQTELREQEVSEASSRAYCRGFCQVGAGPGRGAGCRPGDGPGAGPAGLPRRGACPALPAAKGSPSGGSACSSGAAVGVAWGSRRRAPLRSGVVGVLPRGCPVCAALPSWGRARGSGGAARPRALSGPGRLVAVGRFSGSGGPHCAPSVRSWLCS